MYKLRELEEFDLNIINKWRNQEELIANLGAPYRFINTNVEKKWFQNYMDSRANCVRCAIVSTENEKEILGLISLTDMNSINQSATLHLMIGGMENRGKGMGDYAVKEILKHAFYNLNLRRVELSVLSSNVAATNLYKKNGFIQEGIKKEAVYKKGNFEDIILMAILRNSHS
ncbi:GNAT family protein [Vagococcus carniphilus]|uniref:GNAT family protein n=1 Tax=Vagococcus carniphilus TaxID=218144 RepID=A0AAW8U5K0_9ENTE|nr:GNAT family protein [Vagococcus carniphilus]MDT2833542.1 GNAT family protein [Vagococcus carniphilus]